MATKKTTKRKATLTITAAQYAKMTVIQPIRRAGQSGNRLAALVGMVIGGFVPFVTFTVVHHEVATNPYLWILVVAGLVYSAITVFKWAKMALGNSQKAVAFCVLLEGTLTFVHSAYLTYGALFILIFINATSAACALQIRHEEEV